MKFVLYLLLAYLLVRAVFNLLRAMRGRQGIGTGASRSGGTRRREDAAGASNGAERATRLPDEEDIEDARWEDL